MNTDLVRLAHTGANPERIRRLVERVGWHGAVRRLRSAPETSQALKAALDVDPVERLERLERIGVHLVAEHDFGYPSTLEPLPDRPLWLFGRGTLPDVPAVAVVGARRATRYGIDVARAVGSSIARAGWTVVSGLAAGVDTAAHLGALDGDGTTVAVLGSGIDVWYPRRNRQLGEQILASGGAVLSEFPPGTGPEPWRFPARNRIISGLSDVVIVVEAAVKSGALITARLALEHGRTVMALPGDVTRETSAGTNLLIRDGAHPITELDALVEELELVMGPAPRGVTTDEPHVDDSGLLTRLGPTSTPIDDLAVETGRPIDQILAELGRLELLGAVTVEGGAVRTTR